MSTNRLRRFISSGLVAFGALLPVAERPAAADGPGQAAAGPGQAVTYARGGRSFEGFLVAPPPAPGAAKKRPAVIIAHDFLGLGDYQKEVARKLAREGYVVLAADYYGKGVRPKGMDEASAMAKSYRQSVPELRANIRAAYEFLAAQPNVDATKIVALGYSLGGLAAFELARGGAELAGVVTLWGILENKNPADLLKPGTRVLVVQGTADPFAPAAAVSAFEADLQRSKADYQLVKYAGVAHTFTVPAAGTNVGSGYAYDAKADRRSWQLLLGFLREVAPGAG
ncbi:MAG TPA: dienelactone hydrolase family protein [Polyangiaceae bacterium]|nr:dienelactone hydrolase family protein [Polyangiaceae bacterium]